MIAKHTPLGPRQRERERERERQRAGAKGKQRETKGRRKGQAGVAVGGRLTWKGPVNASADMSNCSAVE